LISIFEFSSPYKKDYKYTVEESLKKETIGLLTLIYRANSRKDKQEVLQEWSGRNAHFSVDDPYCKGFYITGQIIS
jgi:hypothetical protein